MGMLSWISTVQALLTLILEAAFAIRYDSEASIFHHTPVWGTLYLQA